MANPGNQPRNVPDPAPDEDVENEEDGADQQRPNRPGAAPADDAPPPKIKGY